jgi:hypothetical protein
MRVAALYEIGDCAVEVERLAVVYPFDSQRAARAGDPAVHDLSAAVDLFLLATRVLSSRHGEPDFPSSDPTPEVWRADAISVVVWDFDYYQLILELRPAPASVAPGYMVCLRKTAS